MNRISGLLLLLAGIILTVSCVNAPVQEMSDARQTLRAAEAKLTGDESGRLRVARVLLAQAEQALAHHDFRRARSMAVEARETAQSVLVAAE